MPLADNALYTWSPRIKPDKRPISTLLPREQLNVWFHGLFLKLALPMPSLTAYTKSTHQIYSPLNLSILFRQIGHLRLLGYPSHWLSEIPVPVFNGTLTTTTRPPRHSPMEPHHVARKHPVKALCVAPFSAEMKTLATIFAPIFPFRLDPNTIYSLDQIHEYTINLRPFPPLHRAPTEPTCLILLFWRPKSNPPGFSSLSSETDLRQLLDPSWGDEVQNFFEGNEYIRTGEQQM